MGKDAIQTINAYYSDEAELINKKAKYFDLICEMFYKRNFGMANKSEIELVMFSILMDEMIEHNVNADGVVDYKACSDYKMAEMLGIPQDRVKTLKIKKQARYPQKFEWQKSFLSLKESIVYDAEKKRIVIPVSDPNLYLAIRNFIEEHDGYIEIQRGTNVLQMRPEHFFYLLYLGIEDEDEKEKIRKVFVKKLRARNEKYSLENIKTDEEVRTQILEIGDEVFDFFESLADGISNPLLLLIKGVRHIGKIIKK